MPSHADNRSDFISIVVADSTRIHTQLLADSMRSDAGFLAVDLDTRVGDCLAVGRDLRIGDPYQFEQVCFTHRTLCGGGRFLSGCHRMTLAQPLAALNAKRYQRATPAAVLPIPENLSGSVSLDEVDYCDAPQRATGSRTSRICCTPPGVHTTRGSEDTSTKRCLERVHSNRR